MIYIVTITYNDCSALRRTIESVRRNKDCRRQRYVVIDGMSTDQTEVVLRENSDLVDFLIRERDAGIYDAMNKALRIPGLQNDDYIIWINGGDELLPWAPETYEMLREVDGAFCNVYLGVEGVSKFRLPSVDIRIPYDEGALSPASTFFHQGFFVRYGYFRDHAYDLTVGIQAENLLMSRVILAGRYVVSQAPVAKFYVGGTSSHYKALFASWLKVADALGFSRRKLFWRQRAFVAKQLLKMLFPERLVYRLFVKRQIRQLCLEV